MKFNLSKLFRRSTPEELSFKKFQKGTAKIYTGLYHTSKPVISSSQPSVSSYIQNPEVPKGLEDPNVFVTKSLQEWYQLIPPEKQEFLATKGKLWVRRFHRPEEDFMPAHVNAILGNYNPPAVKIKWDHGYSHTGPAMNYVAAIKKTDVDLLIPPKAFDPFEL